MNSGVAVLAYSFLSLVLTWPLAAGLWRDVPGDLGDSLLNMWILAWGAEHLPQLLTGGISWEQFWNANIFHPAPLALSLSEHLFGQVLQILPVYWLTGNIILCYNLLFISTFALSAFGTYLLVRDLTGNKSAAFIAGLVYGFLPYRIAAVPHLQVMSSQWMPFALYGLNRYITATASLPRRSSWGYTRAEAGALAGGTAALVMQNWSCGYYLLYFAPFAPLFVIHRMWALGTLRTLRTWIGLSAAAVGTLILTLPFLLKYVQAQQQLEFERPFGEVVHFSANVWSYVTASENLWLFGNVLRYFPRGEGETFLGFVPLILALVAGVGLLIAPQEPDPSATSTRVEPPWRRVLVWLLVAAVITQLLALVTIIAFGGFELDVAGLPVRARTPARMLMQMGMAGALLLIASPRARAVARTALRSPILFFWAAMLLAFWLSLGPLPKAGPRPVSDAGLYGVLYEYVPGFTGVRVPARYAMVAGLFLAVLAGFGMAALIRRKADTTSTRDQVESGLLVRRSLGEGGSRIAVAAIAVLILIEGLAIPFEINRTWGGNQAMPPARVFPAHALGHRSLGEGVPAVYARVAALPEGSAIAEFPFGDPAWEIRYVYYAAAHWKPVANGYSGGWPPGYKARVARLQRLTSDPDAAWQSLLDSQITHVVLHPSAFANTADAAAVQAWLEAHGATLVESFPDRDALYAIR